MEPKLLCRTCLNNSGELFELFGETGMELALPQKLHDHLKILVEHTDEYTLMCGKCIAVLNEFHDMYSLAQEVQAQFLAEATRMSMIKKEEIVEDATDAVFVDMDSAEFLEQDEDAGHLEEVIIEETIEDEDPVITMVAEESTISYDADYVNEYVDEDLEEEEEDPDDEATDEDPSDIEFSPKVRRREPGPKAVRKQVREAITAEQREEENQMIRSIVNLSCVECGFLFETMEALIFHHRQIHKKNAAVMCCEREFRKRIKLVEHCRLHLDPKAFACSECDKTFSSKYTLSHHMTSHVPEELCDFQCDQCPKKFSTRTRLLTHQKSHSGESFVCHICNKSYTQKGTLYSHIKAVHERPNDAYICEICAKPFKTKEAFLTHQVNHMEVPPPRIACHICSKKMKNRDTLNQHLLRHKRENDRHQCDVCEKVFNCKKRMNQHKKYVHATEKLQCEHCDKTFKRPIYLKEHMASHTGESLYTCSYCPRQFNSNANKYSHQKAQHPEEWQLAKQKRLEE